MPNHPCPNCGAHGARLLEEASEFVDVNYYRCGVCAHMWGVPKNGTGPIQHVTSLQPKRNNA